MMWEAVTQVIIPLLAAALGSWVGVTVKLATMGVRLSILEASTVRAHDRIDELWRANSEKA